MSFSTRIFVGFFLLLALVAYALLSTVFDELKPGFSRATEETLVDTANLVAEILADDMARNGVPDESFAAALDRYTERRFEAHIHAQQKTRPGMRVYVTDRNGKVLLDSAGIAVGMDYSRWNDVYLTLRGEYGARATREDPDDEFSSVYYVAAPVRHDGEIVGAVSVGKPSRALLPYLEASEARIRLAAALLFAGGLVLAAIFAAWMQRSVRRLTAYADAVSRGESVKLPRLRERELASLGNAMARMRAELEGREYVEETVHALTHELKSPLTALRGSVELLRENPDSDHRDRFLDNIENETARMQRIAERMLQLASVERRDQLAEAGRVNLAELVEAALAARELVVADRALHVRADLHDDLEVNGDAFLLEQAIGNLLDNAIEFSPRGGELAIALTRDGDRTRLSIRDSGSGIPDYAQDRVFERFYSLPRPDGTGRSTGLGLGFVREVARLHDGSISVQNAESGGTLATLVLPLAKFT